MLSSLEDAEFSSESDVVKSRKSETREKLHLSTAAGVETSSQPGTVSKVVAMQSFPPSLQAPEPAGSEVMQGLEPDNCVEECRSLES